MHTRTHMVSRDHQPPVPALLRETLYPEFTLSPWTSTSTLPLDPEQGGTDRKRKEGTEFFQQVETRHHRLTFCERLKHFTWAWYIVTMSTGGIATLVAAQPLPVKGLISFGCIFYYLNLGLFFGITILMGCRFTKHRGLLVRSITHKRESLFVGLFLSSIAYIIIGTQKYVLEVYFHDSRDSRVVATAMLVVFWVYTILAFCLAVAQYSFLFRKGTFLLSEFMPSWLIPTTAVVQSGTLASFVAQLQPDCRKMPILLTGLGCQGFGFLFAAMAYPHYIGRLFQSGYVSCEVRSSMFIPVAAPASTACALVNLSNSLPPSFALQKDGAEDKHILQVLALIVALFLWVYAIWLFLIALIAVCHSWARKFHLNWWSMIFPNIALVSTTISIGKSLQNDRLQYIGNALSIGIVLMWLFILAKNVHAVYVADIMYPTRDEDQE